MTFHLTINQIECRVRLSENAQGEQRIEYAASNDGPWITLNISVKPAGENRLSILTPEGTSLVATLDRSPMGDALLLGGTRYAFAQNDPRSLAMRSAGDAGGGPAMLKSPMPGRVVRLLKQTGDAVEAKDGVLVIEAMKMQNELKAPRRGTVESILVAEGDSVVAGQALAQIR